MRIAFIFYVAFIRFSGKDGWSLVVIVCSKSQLLFDIEANFTVASMVVLDDGFVVVSLVCFVSWLLCNTGIRITVASLFS